MGIGVRSNAHQKFFLRASEFRPTGIGILSRGEQPRDTRKSRNWLGWFEAAEALRANTKGRESPSGHESPGGAFNHEIHRKRGKAGRGHAASAL